MLSGLTVRLSAVAWAWLALSGQHIRMDRILDETHATSGDIRALCDMFGMSVANAARYATAIDRIADRPAFTGTDDGRRSSRS